MKIDACSSFLVKADRFFDRAPVASSFTNFIDIFQKSFVLPFMKEESIRKSHYYTHLKEKSFARCLTLLIPVLGNIIIAIIDCAKGKAKDKVVAQPENPNIALADLEKAAPVNAEKKVEPKVKVKKAEPVVPVGNAEHAGGMEDFNEKDRQDLEKVKRDPYAIREASAKVKNHKETVLKVVKEHGFCWSMSVKKCAMTRKLFWRQIS